ncbi:hypothetical protein [Kitasatospora sp. P5_F3]
MDLSDRAGDDPADYLGRERSTVGFPLGVGEAFGDQLAAPRCRPLTCTGEFGHHADLRG